MLTLITHASMITLFIIALAIIWYLISSDPTVIDIGWGTSIVLVGCYYVLAQKGLNLSPKILLACVLLWLWGIRLAAYIYFTRVKPKLIDQRYVALGNSMKFPQKFGFSLLYLFQGVLMLLIATPFLFLGSEPLSTFTLLDKVAFLLIAVGLLGETTADWQLYHYRKKHPGQICKRGFWGFSRHPNYFFEYTIWVGFALLSLHSFASLLAFISPLTLLFIFYKLSIPVTEKQSLKSKGEAFKSYQAKVSKFFPWIPKA